MTELTPKEIVRELDKYIIGQEEAKKAMAIALRNRYRRSLLSQELQEEITPKNIIMMGPTGVGKTEIARRLAKLVSAPFIKVEATKFTEVGYVGRDAESMVRDLVYAAIRMAKQTKFEEVKLKAELMATERLLDLLVPALKKKAKTQTPFDMIFGGGANEEEESEQAELTDELRLKRSEVERKLMAGEMEDEIVEIMVEDNQSVPIGVIGGGMGEDMNINDMLGGILPKKKKKRRVSVSEARKILVQQQADKLMDMDAIIEQGIRDAEQSGIIFLDEIDKIAGGEGYRSGADVSREGVQRDILPIVEGSTVNTKYGPVKTDHILFVAAGAFHMSKVSDLIPELQGRFPIKVKLHNLTYEHFKLILTQPQNAIIMQYQQLLATEDMQLLFEESALEEIAKVAIYQNENNENIGARRLHTVMEKLLEDISYDVDKYANSTFTVSRDYVRKVFDTEEYLKSLEKYII
jgi:ATP-dependent HslUV protease ATP-binding subunit HslU